MNGQIWLPSERTKTKKAKASYDPPAEMMGDAVRIAAVCNRNAYVTQVRCSRGHDLFWCIRFEASLWQNQVCVTPTGEVLETEEYT